MLDETGCAGVSIGRGAFYNPWIFRQTQHYLRTGELLPDPSFDERVRVMCRHLDLMVEVFGEEHGCRMFRKVAAWYAKRCGPVDRVPAPPRHLSHPGGVPRNAGRLRVWRARFCDERGELLPRYRPPELVASSSRTRAQDSIPVPKGPIEVW